MQGIYKITNTINGKVYIGSSINIQKRLQDHKTNLRKNKHINLYLQAEYNEYTEDSFSFESLHECENILFWEGRFIDAYISYNPKYGYNTKRIDINVRSIKNPENFKDILEERKKFNIERNKSKHKKMLEKRKPRTLKPKVILTPEEIKIKQRRKERRQWHKEHPDFKIS